MNKVISAEQISDIKGRSIFLDTNIWMLIEGLNGQSAKYKQYVYTEARRILVANGNVVVFNEYVLTELCNRSLKMAYDFAKEASGLGNRFMRYKEFRNTQEFEDAISVANDTCLNMIEDYFFCSCSDNYYSIDDVISDFYTDKIDISDVLIRKHCKYENYILMSDDADYAGSDIDIITANKRFLAKI